MPVPSAHLKACRLLDGFTSTGLDALATIARAREVPQGMSVFLTGATAEGLFIIQAGSVRVSIKRQGQESPLCKLGPGDHFGELGLLRAGRRAVDVRAEEPTQLIEIRRPEFNALLKKKPQACLKLMLAIFAQVEQRVRVVQPELLRLI